MRKLLMRIGACAAVVVATSETLQAVELTHRWSFNGDYSDSAGGAGAVKCGTYVSLYGGRVHMGYGACSHGTGYVDLGTNMLDTNEVHFVQTHLDWARLPDQDEHPPEDKRFAQRQIKQLIAHFKDVFNVIISADFNVSCRWHFKEFDKAGYTVANDGRYDLLDNVVVKGFDVKDLFSADDERRLSDHRIVGCVIEMRR